MAMMKKMNHVRLKPFKGCLGQVVEYEGCKKRQFEATPIRIPEQLDAYFAKCCNDETEEHENSDQSDVQINLKIPIVSFIRCPGAALLKALKPVSQPKTFKSNSKNRVRVDRQALAPQFLSSHKVWSVPGKLPYTIKNPEREFAQSEAQPELSAHTCQ